MCFVAILFSGLLVGALLHAQTPECAVCPGFKIGPSAARKVTCLSDAEMAAHTATRKPVIQTGLNEPRLSLHGTVAACLCFSRGGKVTRIDILSGHAMLQEFVLESLKKWTFVPVSKGGKNYGGCGRLRVHVEMDDGATSSTLETGNQ